MACALGLRLAYVAQQAGANPLFDFPTVDATIYTSWAHEILSGQWWWPTLRNYLPVFPGFLALCEWICGEGPWGVKIVQSLLSGLSAGLLAVTVARLFGRRTGVLAGALFATNWLFVEYDAERYSESLCLNALVIFLYLFTHPQRSLVKMLGAAVACTVACGCRPNLLPVLVLAVVAILSGRGPQRARIQHASCFLGIAALLFLPVLWHNHRLTGRWMLRAQQYWNLYAALNPDFGGLHPTSGPDFDKYMDAPVRTVMLPEAAQDDYWKREAIRLVRERPAAVLKNYFVGRGLIFVDATEWSQEFDVGAFRGYSSVLSLPWPGFGATFALAGAGFASLGFESFRRRRTRGHASRRENGHRSFGSSRRRFLLAALVVVSLFTFLGKVTGRYRMPVTLLLIPWAAVGVEHLLRRKPGQSRTPALLGLAAAAAMTAPDWADLRDRQTAHHEFFIAKKFDLEGQAVEAEALYREAAAREPRDAQALMDLTRLLARQGRFPYALATITEALRREPASWEGWNLRASIELDLKQFEAALASTDHSVALYAPQFDAWVVRSEVEFELGRWPAWRAASAYALDRGAGPSFRVDDALRLDRHGLFPEAVKNLLRAAKDSRATPAARARAQLLACDVLAIDQHDLTGASACWEQAAARFPEDPAVRNQALFLLGRLSEAEYQARAQAAGPAEALLFVFNQGVYRLVHNDPERAKVSFAEYLQKHDPFDWPPTDVPLRWAFELAGGPGAEDQ